MVKRFLPAMASLLVSTLVCLPAMAQPARARATIVTDLNARLSEAQNDPKLLESLNKTGRKVAAVCANCHGEGGNSPAPDTPNLAGQNATYLVDQLRKFADGTRRFEFMEGMIKSMSSDEKVGVALFYSAQKTFTTPPANPALSAKGKIYYDKICFRCHGETGHGSDIYARLAGQQAAYLKRTLLGYRSGTGGRTDPLMAANTKLMSDNDIEAVVAYVSSMP